MSALAEIPFPAVHWNLSALYSAIDDPKIEATWQALGERVDRFAEQYRDQVATLSPLHLAEALREYEAIATMLVKPVTYANLLYSCDSATPEVGAFLADQMERMSATNVKMLFFDLELQDIPSDRADVLIQDPALFDYKHHLQTVRRYSDHKLSEPEEVILEETANTGCRAWVRLYEELLATHPFYVKKPGDAEATEMTEPEVLALLRESDRDLRQAAADGLTRGLSELERAFVFTYNTLLQDKKVGDRLRRHPYAEHSRHLSNELDKETVDLVVSMCAENYPIVARFYERKRELLGLSELTHIDRYAPLHDSAEKKGWEEGKAIVLDSFGSMSPILRERAAEFFEKNWIDAEPRKGKQGGAFCNYNTPDTHPVVFMNYQNKLDDVMTLAHELGHGVHASLSMDQTYLNYQGTLPLAELASTFGEMLVFERIVADASPSDQLALYAEKCEGVFATVFRQAALYHFEVRAHQARREEGELSAEDYGEIWQEELQRMFGDSVVMGEQHKKWWMMIGHFFFAPFYVYAYSFGELLALSLYAKAKADGPEFVERYIEMLRRGGSQSPQELMDYVGVDLNSREFWQGGFDAIERLVSEFERLAATA